MARFDPYTADEGAYAPSPIARRLGGVAESVADESETYESPLAATIMRAAEARSAAAAPDLGADLAIDNATNEFILAGDQRLPNTPQNAANLVAAIRAGKIPRLGKVPAGASGRSFADIGGIYDRTPEDTAFWRSGVGSAADAIGTAWQGFEALVSDDESELTDNWLNTAADSLREGRTLGQIKADQSGWTGSRAGFVNELGRAGGNVAGNLVMAAPALLAGGTGGSAAGPGGTAGGAIAGAGLALTGATGAGGDAASTFREQAIPMLDALSDEEFEQLPMYEEIALSHPDWGREKIQNAMINRGSKMAALTAVVPGALESLLGGAIGGRALRALKVDTPLGRIPGLSGAGRSAQAVMDRMGLLGRAGKAAGRVGALGTFGGLQEAAEVAIGTSEGNRTIGVGSTDYLENANPEDFSGGFFQSALFGLLPGGGSRGARGEAADDVADAVSTQRRVDAATDPRNAAQRGPLGAALSTTGSPEVNNPERSGRRGEAVPEDLRGFAHATADERRRQDAAAQRQREARRAFFAQTGFQSDAELQSAMPYLLDTADQNPAFKQLMIDAGVYPNMLGYSPEHGPQTEQLQLQPPGEVVPAPAPEMGGSPIADPRQREMRLTFGEGPDTVPVDQPAQDTGAARPGSPHATPGERQRQLDTQSRRQEALRVFGEQTGLRTMEEVQARMPELLDLADQHPGFKALMEDAGLYPTMLVDSPESQQARAATAAADFVSSPRPAGAPAPALSTTRPLPPGLARTNWGQRVRGPESAQRAAVSGVAPIGEEAGVEREPGTPPTTVLPAGELTPEEQAARAATQAQRGAGDLAPAVVAPAAPAAPAPEQAGPAGSSGTEVNAPTLAQWDRDNRQQRSDELFDGAVNEGRALDNLPASLANRPAHGMAKAGTATQALRDLVGIMRNGLDPNRGGGALYTAPLGRTSDSAGAASATGTASGNSYRDGAFILVARDGVSAIRSPSDIDAVLVNPRLHGALDEIRAALPGVKVGLYQDAQATLEGRGQKGAKAKAASKAKGAPRPTPTPEPAADIKAQVAVLRDPNAGRRAVLVQAENAKDIPKRLPKDVLRYVGPNGQILLTRLKEAGEAFRKGKLNDTVLGKLTEDAVQDKGEAAAAAVAKGEPPVVVQRLDEKGNVVAEQVVSQSKAREAIATSKANAGKKGKTTKVTTPQAAQERRGKGAAAIATSKAKKAAKPQKPPPKKGTAGVSAAAAGRPNTGREASDKERKTPGQPKETVAAALTPAQQDTPQIDAALAAAEGVPGVLAGGTVEGGVDTRIVEVDVADYRAAVAEGDTTALDKVLRVLDQIRKAAEEAFVARLSPAERVTMDASVGVPARRHSVLVLTPLLEREAHGLLDAYADLPASHPVRQVLASIGTPRLHPKNWGEYGKTQKAMLARQVALSFRGNDVLRAAARGATAYTRAMQGAQFAELRAKGEPQAKKGPTLVTYGDLPAALNRQVAKWIAWIESGGIKFDGFVRLASRSEYDRLMTTPADANHFGQFDAKWMLGERDRNGMVATIMVDHEQLEGTALEEVAAHEVGHVVVEQLYQRVSDTVRAQIDRQFRNWLSANLGRSSTELMVGEMTPELAALYADGVHGMDADGYVRAFHEWAARHVARKILFPRKPRGPVEAFFQQIADVVGKIYRSIRGLDSPDALGEAMDRWVNGTLDMTFQMPPERHHTPDGNKATTFAARAHAQAELRGDALIEDFERQSGVRFGDRTVDRKTRAQDLAKAVFSKDYDSAFSTLKNSKLAQTFRRAGHRLMTRGDLVSAVEALIGKDLAASLTKWNELVSKREQYAHTQLERAEAVMAEVNAMSQKARDLLNTIMYKATRYGIHPDKPWTDPANKHLHEGDGDVVSSNHLRYMEMQTLWSLASQANPQIITSYSKLLEINEHFHKARYDGRVERINASKMSEANKAEFLKEAKDAYDRSVRGPYFSLKRHGDWVVKVTMPSHVVGVDGKVNGEAFKTRKEAQAEAAKMRALSPGAAVSIEKFEDEGYMVRVFQKAVRFYNSENDARDPRNREALLEEVREEYKRLGLDFDAIDKEIEEYNDNDEGRTIKGIVSEPFATRDSYNTGKTMGAEFSARLKKALEAGEISKSAADVLTRLEFESLPENNFRKSLLPRENIIGADPDMLSSFASHVHSAATDLSDIKYGGQIDKEWRDAGELKTKHPRVNEYLDAIDKQQDQFRLRMREGPYKNFAGWFSKVNSIYSLGFSVPYAVTNMSQPWMVTVPMMGGLTNQRTGKAVGMKTAAQHMKRAYADTFQFFSKKGIEDFKREMATLRGKGTAQYTDDQFTEDMLQRFSGGDATVEGVLRELQEQGLLTQTFVGELQDAMSDSWAGRKTTALQRLSLAFPAQVEAINRIVTAKAAVSLAREEHVLTSATPEPMEIADFARDMLVQTQGNYARSNRAWAFNTPVLEQALMFKPYVQMMYMTFVRTVAKAARNAKPGDRAEAIRQLRNVLMSHFAVAGAAGLGPIAWAAKLALVTTAFMFGDDDDEKWKDGDTLMQDLLEDLMGDAGANFVNYGAAGLLGADVSSRINLPTPLDVKFTSSTAGDRQASKFMDDLILSAAGAGWANWKRVAQGGEDLFNGDVTNAANALPNAVRPLVRGIANASRGVVDRDGDTFIRPEDLTFGDTIVQLTGATPVQISDKYAERGRVKGAMARIREQREALMRKARNGDDVADEIRQFNATVPAGSGYKITRDALLKSKQAKAKRDAGQVSKDEAAVRRMLER